MRLLSKLFKFVITTSVKYNIDESHGLSHSMNVLQNSHNIYESELVNNPELYKMKKIIYVSSVLHDMCDKKYVVESDGINNIQDFLEDKLSNNEILHVKNIVSTMSYSTVKRCGFPDLGEIQMAYHIVREADLLSAYDFDRCMIYKMYNDGSDIKHAFDDAVDLFYNRVFQHETDKLLITKYSKDLHYKLKEIAINRIIVWDKILSNSGFYTL